MSIDNEHTFLEPTLLEEVENVDALQDRLRDDPEDLIASARLEDIYRADGDWSPLAKVLLDRAAGLHNPVQSAELLREAAILYRERLGNDIAARSALLSAFACDPRSVETANALEQLAFDTGQWIETLDAYAREAMRVSPDEPELGSDLWLRIACAHIVGTGDMMAAHRALENVQVLKLDRSCSYLDLVEQSAATVEALETLARVSRRAGDWPRLSRVLSRAIAMSADVARKAYFHHLLGELEAEHGNEGTAEWHLNEALRLDPLQIGTRQLLASMYRSRGEHRRAAQVFDSGRAVTADAQQRAELAVEAAGIYANDLGENTCAIDLYHQALQADPAHVGAALPLADRYFEEGRWSELEPLIDMLVLRRDALGTNAPAEVEAYYRAGQCSLQLKKLDKARFYFHAAIDSDPMHLPSLLGAARTHHLLGNWDTALDNLDKALVLQRSENRSDSEISDTLFRMAETRRCRKDGVEAMALYRKCLELGGLHRGALTALCELCGERGEHAEVVELKSRFLCEMEPAEQVETLAEMAGLTMRKLRDPHAAIQIYLQALDIDPGCRYALHQLTELYSAAGRWQEAVDTILRVAELETDSYRKGKYLHAAATFAQQELGVSESLGYLNEALDCFFAGDGPSPGDARERAMSSFRDIVEMLAERGEWKKLERNYRRMIKRLHPDDPDVAPLWSELGDIYRERLGQRYAAINSFEVASALDSQRLTNHRILIDLYENAGADQLDKAIERRFRLISFEPFKVEHYKALRSLYVRTGQMDKVWCVCRALEYLGQADDSERAYYRRHLIVEPRWPALQLNAEMWTRLRHDDEDPLVSRILGLVCEAIALDTAVSPRKLDLRDDTSPHFATLRQLYGAVVHSLGIPGFPAHVQPGLSGEIFLANIKRDRALRPAIVLGRGLYEGRTVQAIVHTIARMMTYARRSYYLRLAMVTEGDLEAAFRAALVLSHPQIGVPPQIEASVSRYRRALEKRLHPTWKDKLAVSVDKFLRSGARFDRERWSYAVDAAARRAGLLLTGDLDTAIHCIGNEPLFTAGVAHSDKVEDLLVHSVSEDHMSLRADLSIGIDAA